jgi:DNA-binding XRE family transcriptional regulator
MTIPFEKFKARLLANPKVKAEYDALAPEFEIAAELLRARLRAGLSQAELAARMRTSQSTIARLESGQTLPGPRRCCAMPRRSCNGAPRPMKMGTIVSPWRYDAALFSARKPTRLRRAVGKLSLDNLGYRSMAGEAPPSPRGLGSDCRERIEQRHAGHDNVRDRGGFRPAQARSSQCPRPVCEQPNGQRLDGRGRACGFRK